MINKTKDSLLQIYIGKSDTAWIYLIFIPFDKFNCTDNFLFLVRKRVRDMSRYICFVMDTNIYFSVDIVVCET